MKQLNTRVDREAYLEREFPGIYVAMLKAFGRQVEREAYCRSSVHFYTIYALHYLPKIHRELERTGQLDVCDRAQFN